MDMENSRRSFDRSREPGIKKPRLTDELERGPNPTVRPFPQRQVATGVNTLASARFRTNDRDSGSGDSGRPQQLLHQELVTQYKTALAELTFNSKPIITNLTIIAGENLYAAKAIAATVCSNILEVPSEQKLPSLYLLDSIVKNIGRDYIKYFAARLPEVFCKAYRQVGPSVHTSMRHLFGTWKGVFPLQTLQMIEKDLGFTPAVNGSSSASTTQRSDSQSQRPPHSIHVNPKYLERQRLEQSSGTKGLVNDMTGAIAKSTEDKEKKDRALVAARPLLDPRLNALNITPAHRDAFNDSVPEKSISASYGGSEHGSDLSSKVGLGIGRPGSRVTDLGHDKARYKAGSNVAEVKSGQKNGLSLKHGLSNHEAPKSLIVDARHQLTQSLTSTRSSVISNSWKNSEEEEFMWDDMDSRLTEYGASRVSNNLSKDHWTADDENLEVEDHLQTTQYFGANVGREISTESLLSGKKQLPAFGHRPSLSWQLQEQHSIDELNYKPGHSEGFVSTLGGLPTSTNSSAVRVGNRPFLPNAPAGMVGQQNFHTVQSESPFGQSPLRQQSPSLPETVLHPHHLQNWAEQDHQQTLKTSHFSGDLQGRYSQDSSPALPPNVQAGNLRKSQQTDLQGLVPSVTSFQPSHRIAVSQQQLGSSHTEVSDKNEKLPQSKVSLASETSDQSTPSSLLAAVMKSGIFNSSITSNLPTTSFLDISNLPSQLGVRPTQPGEPQGKDASLSSLGPPNDDSSSMPKLSRGKVGQPPSACALPPASSTVNSTSVQTSNSTNTSSPISNLLSSLVAKGLISAESSNKVPTDMLTRLEDQSHSNTTSSSSPVASVSGSPAIPVSSIGDEVDHDANSSVSLSQSTTTEIRNLIGFEFKPDVIRQLHPSVIRGLLDDLPHHCSICGLRLKHQEQFNGHLEWHVIKEREQNGLTKASRRWYATSSEWIGGKVECPSEYEYTNSADAYREKADKSELDAMVPADENQCLCLFCGELFEDVYCQERDEWMFKGAAFLTRSDSDGEMGIGNVSTTRGPIIHSKCLSEASISSIAKMEQD